MTNEIENEALRWLKLNEKRSCSTSQFYGSPRISSEYPDCSTPFSFDLYNFCSFGCLYCFAYFQKMNNPSVNTEDGGTLKSVNVQEVIDLFEGKDPENPYYKRFIKNRYVLHVGGMADNFCNFERVNKVGVKLMEYWLSTGYPMIISTKGDFLSIPEYKELFTKYKDVANCAIQSSIITDDDIIGRRIEVGVPTPTKRYENLRQMSELGYYTILRLRPFIIGISDRQLDSLLNKMVEYKIHAISTEFYAMDMRVDDEVKKRYKWMSDICGFDIVEYYKQLSPTERGTYRRLNRKVKEPYIKKMYKFCIENKKTFACSDPDFKELNMTGSCCGLPDDTLKWGGLANWMKNQLTQQLRKLRIRYWNSKGVDKYLSLEDMKEDKIEHQWKLDHAFYKDSVCKVGMSTAMLSQMDYWKEFVMAWNNTRSPKCPYNYFHGKIKPSGQYDKGGNIIYEYVPHQYEIDWMKEGFL